MVKTLLFLSIINFPFSSQEVYGIVDAIIRLEDFINSSKSHTEKCMAYLLLGDLHLLAGNYRIAEDYYRKGYEKGGKIYGCLGLRKLRTLYGFVSNKNKFDEVEKKLKELKCLVNHP